MIYEAKVWCTITAVFLALAGVAGYAYFDWKEGCDDSIECFGGLVTAAFARNFALVLLGFAAVAGFITWRVRKEPD